MQLSFKDIPKSMLKKFNPTFFICTLLLASVIAQGCKSVPNKSQTPRVAIVQVMQLDVPLTGILVGQTYGSVDLDIRARVDGQIETLHFSDGEPVEQGQLLYTIDPKPLEARVVAAKSELDRAITALNKAKADLARISPLAKIDAVSKKDLDAAIASHESALASVNTQRANLEHVQIQLGYASITAPASGIIGISQARVGDYVGKEPSPIILNTITQNDPIRVRVALGEREYLTFAKRLLSSRSGAPDSDTYADSGELELILADETIHPWKGTLASVNSQLNSKTGTLTLEFFFRNPQLLIRPGQYAKIRFVKEVKKNALVVWQRAVQEVQDLYQVYIVDQNNTVIAKQVQPGEKIDGMWIIEKGLSPSDRVIVEGTQRVRPGMTVEALPPEELNVTPPTSSLLPTELSRSAPSHSTARR